MNRALSNQAAVLLFMFAASAHAAVQNAPAGVKGALDGERIGLFAAADFRLATGKCADCPTVRQALWYFPDDLLAVPKNKQQAAGYSPNMAPTADVARWAKSEAAPQQLTYPGLVWIGSPLVLDQAALLPGGEQVKAADGTLINLQLAPKLSSNRSYANADTTAFFGRRQIRIRGALEKRNGKDVFVARTIWPLDYTLEADKLALKPLARPADLASRVRESKGGAAAPFSAQVLWERRPRQSRQWADKAVIGIMLNGAQGDDDEALGGHFAIATGRYGARGEWADWTVNNFYNLDSVSEKGIIASTVPMDNYLMDLNSGQQYYRPSYMLVAVLNNPRTAIAYQGGVQRTFNHFYRHDFTYQHAAANCAGISIDVFRALGWNVPKRGPTGRVKGVGAYVYLSAKDRSFASGRKIYDYLTEEQTRLYPAVAFEAAGLDMLGLVGALPMPSRQLSTFEKELQGDMDAIILVRIPQLPSSRVLGADPVFGFDEYLKRVPKDRSKWKVVPVDPRPFPAALRDAAVPAKVPAKTASADMPLPVFGLGAFSAAGVGAFVYRRKKRQDRRRGPTIS